MFLGKNRFHLNVVASDETGGLEIILEDQEVRILTGTRAEEVYKEVSNSLYIISFYLLRISHPTLIYELYIVV